MIITQARVVAILLSLVQDQRCEFIFYYSEIARGLGMYKGDFREEYPATAVHDACRNFRDFPVRLRETHLMVIDRDSFIKYAEAYAKQNALHEASLKISLDEAVAELEMRNLTSLVD